MQPKYPLLTDRMQSTFIDTIFLVVLMFIASVIIERFHNVPDWVRIIIFFGIWGIYEPLCTSLGFTLGNYIKGLRVRRLSDTSKHINFLQAFGRYILKLALGWISFLTIHSNEERQAIHDMFAGSVVIEL